jgi:GR25 family glycosyltransferase involved in LPS biosynthesis
LTAHASDYHKFLAGTAGIGSFAGRRDSVARGRYIDANSFESSGMQCYVINLDRDAERMARMRAALAHYPFIAEVRINALRGSDLPDVACDLLTTKPAMRNFKGTLGCGLSHAAAWEAIVRNDAACSLVLEDDSEVTALENLRELRLPAGVDLVFCNSRMVYQDSGTELLPVLPALEFMVRNGTAVGSDGYLLSSDGARKLLGFFARDGFYSHVDLRLAAYCLTLEEMESLPQKKYVIRDICTLRRIYDPTHHIDGRVLGTALTKHVKGALSSRSTEDMRGSIKLG